MRMPSLALCAAFFVAACGVMIGGGTTAEATVLGPGVKVDGKTRSQWAAEWWKWALEAPTPVNPVLDPTGEFCNSGQNGDPKKHVWFLAGSFGAGKIRRECTIPFGKTLFFPIINSAYFAFLNDPPDTRTEEYVRKAAHCNEYHLTSASIDGVPVANPYRFFEQFVLFDVQLPEENVFGLTPDVAQDLLLSPSVDEGYSVFVSLMTTGKHTVKWTASATGCGVEANFSYSQDDEYELTIAPR